MKPIEKAIWFVESHFASGISLGDIAATAGVSRFVLARMFSEAVGVSAMRYVRARRLSADILK